MVSTVTTSTVTTITSMTSVTSVTTMIGFGVTLGLVAVIALATFLCARELAAASDGSNRGFLVRSLDVSIAPLTIAFAMIVAMKVVEILG